MKALFYRDLIANKSVPLVCLVLGVFLWVTSGDDFSLTEKIVSLSLLPAYAIMLIHFNPLMSDQKLHADRYYQAALSPREIVAQRFLSLGAGILLMVIVWGVLGSLIADLPTSLSWLIAAAVGLFLLLFTGLGTPLSYAFGSWATQVYFVVLFGAGLAAVFAVFKLGSFWQQLESLVVNHTNALTAATIALMIVLSLGLYELSVRVYRRRVI